MAAISRVVYSSTRHSRPWVIFKANNGKNCHNISLCEIATNNCELKITHGLEWRVELYTTRDIAANVELCWSYGKDFSIELRPAKCTTCLVSGIVIPSNFHNVLFLLLPGPTFW